ncbi:MAG: OmpA family protein [Candidatus Dadabacteria bacterium]|nr:OmpA family protein [Candidatus Dadabacteria bacterium]
MIFPLSASTYIILKTRFKYPLNILIKTLFIFIFISCYSAHFLFAQASIKKNIFFEYDDSTLRPESVKTLNFYIKKINTNPGSKLTITGYSDRKGASDYNKTLSEKRVKAVIDYFEKKGIQKKKISAKSLGSTTQFSKGESEKSLKMNRRVEITLLVAEKTKSLPTGNTEKENIIIKKKENGFVNTVEIRNIVSHELKKIAAKNIEYITPGEMKKGEPGLIEAVVSESILKNLIKRLNNSTYKRISGLSDIDIKGFILSGDGFLIKKLQGEKFGKWAWEVTPNEKGISSLTLIAIIQIDPNEDKQTYNVPLYLKGVDVKSGFFNIF